MNKKITWREIMMITLIEFLAHTVIQQIILCIYFYYWKWWHEACAVWIVMRDDYCDCWWWQMEKDDDGKGVKLSCFWIKIWIFCRFAREREFPKFHKFLFSDFYSHFLISYWKTNSNNVEKQIISLDLQSFLSISDKNIFKKLCG